MAARVCYLKALYDHHYYNIIIIVVFYGSTNER